MIVLAAVLVLLIGCGRGGEESLERAMAEPAGSMVRMAAAEAPKSEVDLLLEPGRKKILTADIQLEVRDLETLDAAVKELVAEYEGWVDRSGFWETSLSMTVRIPVESLDAFLDKAGDFGKVLSKNLNAEDVTDYYFDTQSRLETLYILKERFTTYLKEAESIKDIIEIERELSSTIAEIESMEGTMKRLEGQISYATVYLNGELPPEEQVDNELPSVLEGLKRLGYGFITLLYYIGLGLLYAIVFGVPIILVLGLIYLVGFGRIGLVRKFFRALSGKRREQQ